MVIPKIPLRLVVVLQSYVIILAQPAIPQVRHVLHAPPQPDLLILRQELAIVTRNILMLESLRALHAITLALNALALPQQVALLAILLNSELRTALVAVNARTVISM